MKLNLRGRDETLTQGESELKMRRKLVLKKLIAFETVNMEVLYLMSMAE